MKGFSNWQTGGLNRGQAMSVVARTSSSARVEVVAVNSVVKGSELRKRQSGSCQWIIKDPYCCWVCGFLNFFTPE